MEEKEARESWTTQPSPSVHSPPVLLHSESWHRRKNKVIDERVVIICVVFHQVLHLKDCMILFNQSSKLYDSILRLGSTNFLM